MNIHAHAVYAVLDAVDKIANVNAVMNFVNATGVTLVAKPYFLLFVAAD